MAKRAVGFILAIALVALGMAQGARAQSTDPYTAGYCEPDPQTKLLNTNRAYLILPKGPDSPPLYFSYQILETGKFVQRRGQFFGQQIVANFIPVERFAILQDQGRFQIRCDELGNEFRELFANQHQSLWLERSANPG